MLAPFEYEGTQTRGYLDTATYGLPPRSTLAAVEEAAKAWRERGPWLRWEEDGEACRELFARIIGADPGQVAFVGAASVAAGIVAASLEARAGDNIVLYERDFDSVLFPWRPLAERGVELRHVPLERLVDVVDDRTVLAAFSLVQSADGRVADLDGLKDTGVRLFVDGTQTAGGTAVDIRGIDYLVAHSYKWLLSPRGRVADLDGLKDTGVRLFVDGTQTAGGTAVDIRGIDYLVAHSYKWLLSPRGLAFLYVDPDRLGELTPWLAGWKSRSDPFGDYYGAPELAADAHRLDISIPWFSAAGARTSLGLIADLGPGAIAEHNLDLARSFCSELGIPEPASPIVRVEVANAAEAVERLRGAGVSCSARSGSIRFAFHLYNDPADVDLALEALAPNQVFDAQS